MTTTHGDGPAPAVIVTGAGTGIGQSTARAFAAGGARVLAVGRTESTLAETAAGHDGIQILAADITEQDAPARVVGHALAEFGRLDVLVNNAAIGVFGSLADLTPEGAEAQIRTNLLAPIFLAQAALDPLAESGGVVVNVGSSGATGLRSWPGNGVYGATKAGLDFLTRTWAVELAERGVRVVSLAPGVIDTGVGLRAGMDHESYQGFLKHIAGRTPSGRVGRPEEIAEWIVFLTRAESAFANGTVLSVDGGLSVT
ncbi:SDR family oxidoreductase [Spirillospora sp. NPDC047279]|uniref:SDR family NAD(P)-dependent oxidoreductase n=1 Tax=Spirillospora sp. NPDC047279 TaxID=3155478 RepID=UPI0033D8EA10